MQTSFRLLYHGPLFALQICSEAPSLRLQCLTSIHGRTQVGKCRIFTSTSDFRGFASKVCPNSPRVYIPYCWYRTVPVAHSCRYRATMYSCTGRTLTVIPTGTTVRIINIIIMYASVMIVFVLLSRSYNRIVKIVSRS